MLPPLPDGPRALSVGRNSDSDVRARVEEVIATEDIALPLSPWLLLLLLLLWLRHGLPRRIAEIEASGVPWQKTKLSAPRTRLDMVTMTREAAVAAAVVVEAPALVA